MKTISQRRRKLGLSQSELARRAGLDRVHVARLEAGRSANPTVDTLYRLALALDCRPSDLLTS